MRKIDVSHWYGDIGNNFIQMIQAIHYANINNCDQVVLPGHKLLSGDGHNIILHPSKKDCNDFYERGSFYFMGGNYTKPTVEQLTAIYQEYIKPISKIHPIIANENELVINIRSNEVFNNNPPCTYLQPPMYYYGEAIKKHSKKYSEFNITIVTQLDMKNPCIEGIKEKYPQTVIKVNGMETDLNIICGANHLVVGVSTFSLIPLYVNKNIESYYLPGYLKNPVDPWQLPFIIDDIQNWFIDLPGYIQNGTWHNTPEQRKIMMEYTPV